MEHMSYLPCELCCLVRENNDVTDVLKAAADDHLAAVALVGAEGNSDILPTVRTEIFRFIIPITLKRLRCGIRCWIKGITLRAPMPVILMTNPTQTLTTAVPMWI